MFETKMRNKYQDVQETRRLRLIERKEMKTIELKKKIMKKMQKRMEFPYYAEYYPNDNEPYSYVYEVLQNLQKEFIDLGYVVSLDHGDYKLIINLKEETFKNNEKTNNPPSYAEAMKKTTNESCHIL